MLFPTHLVAGYLIGRYMEAPVLWVVVGAGLPDVIDKPLAMVGIVDLYHTIGHSLLAVLLLGVVAIKGGMWLGLWIGWVSHLALDAVQMIVNGRPEDIAFLLWPFVHHVPAVQLPPVEFVLYYVGTPSFFLEGGLWLLLGVVLIRERGS